MHEFLSILGQILFTVLHIIYKNKHSYIEKIDFTYRFVSRIDKTRAKSFSMEFLRLFLDIFEQTFDLATYLCLLAESAADDD